MDPSLNNLLKWSLANSHPSPSPSSTTTPDPTTTTTTSPTTTTPPTRSLSPTLLKALMGGPSDADLMRHSMSAIQSPDVSLADKLTAFDNLEQLIEGVDNANNMQALGLWTPLMGILKDKDGEGALRRMAAWVVGTAVQNNGGAQERLLVVGGIPILVDLALDDPDEAVRRKAIYALSSEIRNYQPALDAAIVLLPEDVLSGGVDPGGKGAGGGGGEKEEEEDMGKGGGEGRKDAGAAAEKKGIDAGDMEAVDKIIEALRQRSELFGQAGSKLGE